MKKIIYTISILVFVSCGSTKLLSPTQADVDRGAKKYTDITLASLNEGKSIFETECTKCHSLKDPKKKSEAQWKTIVPRMTAKANKKAGSEVIDARKQELILQYVSTMSN
ncbi:MAG: c-type cytochrome [Bacteroidetes bacterium]|nr:c-type cytochrome [Bacteroidota bacterium]